MNNIEILDMVCRHYSIRGFPKASIEYLRSLLNLHVSNGSFSEMGPLILKSPILFSSLENCFPITQIPSSTKENYAQAEAIFAFAFGYQTKGKSLSGIETYLPGANNLALAAISQRLKLSLNLPVFAQFEIAAALEEMNEVRADYSTPWEKVGTKKLIEYFLLEMERRKQSIPKKVVLVAHEHHMMRCILVLRSDYGIVGVSSVEKYDQYDPKESQARAKSPNAFIISDFVSMASHGAWE